MGRGAIPDWKKKYAGTCMCEHALTRLWTRTGVLACPCLDGLVHLCELVSGCVRTLFCLLSLQ